MRNVAALMLFAVTTQCSAHTRHATAMLKRSPAGGAGTALLPLRVAESLITVDGDHTVVFLCASLPLAQRANGEWRAWCSREWDCCQVSTGAQSTVRALPRSDMAGEGGAVMKRRPCVYFCSFESAPQLEAELEQTEIDLLVCDVTAVDARAVRPQRLVRMATHDGFFCASRRLVLRLDGLGRGVLRSSPQARAPPEEADDELCIITALGTSCVGGGSGQGGSSPRPGAIEAGGLGSVARRIATPDSGPDCAARLVISADGTGSGWDGIRILSASQAREAVGSAAPAAKLPDPLAPSSRIAPHLIELALAVLYIFLV